MDSDDLLALPARCPTSLAAGGSVIPPIGAIVMASLALSAVGDTADSSSQCLRRGVRLHLTARIAVERQDADE
jgi:hypothetical protein